METDNLEMFPTDHRLSTVGGRGKLLAVQHPAWPTAIMANNLDLAKEVAWHYHAALTGVNAKKTDEGWLMVLKAEFKEGAKVAFVGGRDYAECLEETLFMLESRGLHWREDRFA